MTTCFIGNVSEKNVANCGDSPNSPRFFPHPSFLLDGILQMDLRTYVVVVTAELYSHMDPKAYYKLKCEYRIAGNFCEVKFSEIQSVSETYNFGNHVIFHSLNFVNHIY